MTQDTDDTDDLPAETINNWRKPQILFGRYELPEVIYVGVPALLAAVVTGFGGIIIDHPLWTIFGLSFSFILTSIGIIVLIIKPTFLRTYEFIRQRTRWLTRQRVRRHDRDRQPELRSLQPGEDRAGADDDNDGRRGLGFSGDTGDANDTSGPMRTVAVAGGVVLTIILGAMASMVVGTRFGISPKLIALAVGFVISCGAFIRFIRDSAPDQQTDIGDVDQPPNVHHRLGWLLRRMPILSWFADSSERERTQDMIPVKRLHTNPRDQFIELDNDTWCAYVVTSPPNLPTQTATDEDWDRRVDQAKDGLSADVDFYFEYVSVEVPLENPEYRQAYERIVDGRADAADLRGMDRLRADQAEERLSLIEGDENTVNTRLDMWIATVHPGDLINRDDAASFWGSITNAPIIGKRVRARRAKRKIESEIGAEFVEEMRSELRDRRARMVRALNSVEGMTAESMSIVDATRALMAHYHGTKHPWDVDDETLLSLLSAGPVIDAVSDTDADTAAVRTRTDPLGDESVDLSTQLAERLEQNRISIGACDPDAIRDDYGYDLTPGERRVAENFRSLVAPSVQRHDDQRFIVLNENEAVAGVWIEGLPDRLTAGAFRAIAHDTSVNATVALHASALPRMEAEAEARDEKLNAGADANAKGDEWGAVRDRERAQAAADIEHTIAKTNSALYITSTYVILRAPVGPDGDEGKHINAMRESIERDLPDDPSRMQPEPAFYEDALKLLHTTAPLGRDLFAKHRPMTASGIAKQTLHSTATFHESTGVEFGIHDDTNQALVVDPFARDTGSNMGAFGKIRTGKSTTTKMVANEIKERYPEYDVHWVDPLEGLAGPALANEADRIPVGGDVGLNVFDVEPPSDDKIDVIGAAAPYRMLVDRVMSLIETYYSIEERSLTGKKDTWEVAVRETLDDFGIVPNDPDTLRREKPTLRDVIRKLGAIETNAEQYRVDDLETEQSADHRAEIASRIRTEDIGPFLDGGKFAHLAEPTGFDLSESGGAYLDLQLREAKGEVGLQLGLLLMAVYEQAKRSDSPTVILIDEAHYLLKHADNLEFLEQVIRHSGHYQISIIFSTQNVTDFFKKTGDDDGAELTLRDSAKKILDNMSIMMFHHLPEMSETIADELKLNADEARYIRNATPGSEGNGYSEMLLAIDDSGERHTYPARVEMDWNTNPVEFSIIDYDPSNPDHGAWHDYLGERLGDRYDGDDSWSTAVDTWTAGKQVHDRPDPDADAQERAEQQVEIRAQEQPPTTSEGPPTTTTGADTSERETDATTMSTDTQSPTRNASTDDAESVATIPTRAITGIGPSTADTLADHGIETVSDVIETGVTALAEIDGFRHARAATVIDAARDTADREADTIERTDRFDARISSDGERAHIGRRRSTSEQEGDD